MTHLQEYISEKCHYRNINALVKLQKPYLKASKIYHRAKDSKDLKTLVAALNDIAQVYKNHEEEENRQIKLKAFDRKFNGFDFNDYFYLQNMFIHDLWSDLKRIYHDVHWDKNGFNVY